MNPTKIEWADFTFNPIVGCLTNCPYCYARRLATTRLAHLCPDCATFTPHIHPERLDQPLHVKRPALIFADSMSDWWSLGVAPWWRRTILDQVAAVPWHRFVVLTKRPDNILESDTRLWPSNAWLGVSITSGADWWRWEALAKLPERIHKFVSVEPLLGPGVATRLYGQPPLPEWVIVGPQSGAGAVSVDKEWQQAIRNACIERWHVALTPIPLFEKPGLPLQPAVRQMPADLASVFRKKELLT